MAFKRPSTYCKFGGCKNNSNMHGVHFYRFPKDENRCQTWVKACNNKKIHGISALKLNSIAKVCSSHFHDWCFLNKEKHRLVHNAIPDSPKPQESYCNSPCSEFNLKRKELTQDEDMLQKWREAIRKVYKEISERDNVCELHFDEDDILRYYETRLSDGSIWKLRRGKTGLKKGAVPTIFPDLKVTQSKRLKRKSKSKINESEREITSNKNFECNEKTDKYPEHPTPTVSNDDPLDAMKVKTKYPEHPTPTVSNDDPIDAMKAKTKYPELYSHILSESDPIKTAQNEYCKHSSMIVSGGDPMNTTEKENSEYSQIVLNEVPGTFTFVTLVDNLELIPKPSLSWGITAQDEFVMCAKWEENGTLVKRVIVNCSLQIQVFFYKRAIDFDHVKLSSTRDLRVILLEIDKYRVCINANNIEIECDGYILPRLRGNQCEFCQLIGKVDLNQSKTERQSWLSKGKNFSKQQKLYDKIYTLNARNALLTEQVRKLIKIKAVWRTSKDTSQNPVKG